MEFDGSLAPGHRRRKISVPPSGVLVVRGKLNTSFHRPDLLSAEESDRSNSISLKRIKNRFVERRVFLRILLAEVTGFDPAAFQFTYTPRGKPRLSEPAAARHLEFNLTHSEDRVLVALALGFPVGVDIERIDPGTHLAEIEELFFGIDLPLSGRSAAARARIATEWWVGTEALQKAFGAGMAPLFSESAPVDAPNVGGFRVRPVEVDAGYVGAVAAHGSGWSLEVSEW